MTTTQIIILVVILLIIAGLLFLYFRGGSHLNQLEDELWPECDCMAQAYKNANRDEQTKTEQNENN